METFYNCRRLYSTPGYVSPMQFEKSLESCAAIECRIMERLSGTSNRGRFTNKMREKRSQS